MNWTVQNNTLIKTFEFKSFVEVVSFINTFTPICEDMLHHPDFTVYDYKFIRFSLTTHDSQSLSEKDKILAKRLDELYIALSEN